MLKTVAITSGGGGGNGTVTQVGGTGTVNGITLTGNVTTTGNLTLGGTLGNIANSQLTNSAVTIGNTSVSLGSTITNIGNLTLANVTITSGTVPAANVTGLGTMATQNANAVVITGGTANLTSANITYTGASSNIGSLSVGGAVNTTADTGLIASFVGNATTYSYIAVQNKLTSNTAYGSYSLYNDLGTIYADFGINSSNYSYVAAGFPNNSFSLPNATFIQSGANSDLTIGTNGANAVHLLANGSTSTSDALTINANNTVTIANLAAGTSSTATFATPSLPLVPAGYLTINLNGTVVKIPYYAV